MILSLYSNLERKADALIKKLDDIFNLRLNKVMSSTFEESDPDLFDAYKLTARKEHSGTRKVAIKGMIQNKETGEVLKGVHIIIPNLKIDHRCRGKKSCYQIKNVETDKVYTVSSESCSFTTQYQTL